MGGRAGWFWWQSPRFPQTAYLNQEQDDGQSREREREIQKEGGRQLVADLCPHITKVYFRPTVCETFRFGRPLPPPLNQSRLINSDSFFRAQWIDTPLPSLPLPRAPERQRLVNDDDRDTVLNRNRHASLFSLWLVNLFLYLTTVQYSSPPS